MLHETSRNQRVENAKESVRKNELFCFHVNVVIFSSNTLKKTNIKCLLFTGNIQDSQHFEEA